MNRYGKYFLQNILWLDDGFCQYYLQDNTGGHPDILDVESVIFNWPEEARQWIDQCIDHDPFNTLRRLRGFLADHCLNHYNLHRMNNHRVVREACRQIARSGNPLVIEPRMGWVIKVDASTAEPVQPIAVEPEPNLDSLLAELKTELDALVANQQKNYDLIEAELAKTGNVGTAALYGKKAGIGVWDETGGSLWGMVKAFPSFYAGYLKTLWKIAMTPGEIGLATAQSIMTGSTHPLEDEINQIVNPIAQSYEQARQYKSMLLILYDEPAVYELLYDFGQRYYKATHKAELTKIGAGAVSGVIVTILLAIFTAGTGAAANLAAKVPRLVKLFKLLEKITKTLKRIGPRHRMPKKRKSGLLNRPMKKTPRAHKNGMPEPKSPKKKPDVDHKAKKEYSDKDKGGGPKTTPKIAGDKGSTVNVDGHKIYDPSHPPLSSNPKAQYRFSDPSYRSTGGDVYFGENVGTAFHEVRKNVHGKSLYVGEARVDNILDLSDPDVVKQMNIDPGKLTARVDDVVAQKKVYGYTNQIANQAYDAGYSGIVYPSSRKVGSNAVVLFEGRYDPKAIKPILDMSIP